MCISKNVLSQLHELIDVAIFKQHIHKPKTKSKKDLNKWNDDIEDNACTVNVIKVCLIDWIFTAFLYQWKSKFKVNIV